MPWKEVANGALLKPRHSSCEFQKESCSKMNSMINSNVEIAENGN